MSKGDMLADEVESNDDYSVVERKTNNAILQILLDSHSAFIAFLRSHVGSHEAAEDILQHGLMRAVEKHEDLQSHENIVAWFYTVLRNLIADHYRSIGATDRKHQRFLSEETTKRGDRSVLESEFGKAICGCLVGLIDLLNPDYADVIRRIDFNGEELESAATALGISPGNLSVRLHRARQALKKSLVRACGTCTEHKCLDCSCK
jgi:RNA polymerase sigma-70 factor (ECF subfamily)